MSFVQRFGTPLTRRSRYTRAYSTAPPKPPRSPHASWYSDMVPGMIPVAILGSAVYLGLQLVQGHLSHEKYLDEARARVKQLEAEVDMLRRVQQEEEREIAAPASHDPTKGPHPSGVKSRGWAWWSS